MDRPYEPLNMTTEMWRHIEPRWVRTSMLKFSQETIQLQGLLDALNGKPSYSGDAYPHIVVYEGTWWVSDGHHRIIIDMIRGKEDLLARVLFVPPKRP